MPLPFGNPSSWSRESDSNRQFLAEFNLPEPTDSSPCSGKRRNRTSVSETSGLQPPWDPVPRFPVKIATPRIEKQTAPGGTPTLDRPCGRPSSHEHLGLFGAWCEKYASRACVAKSCPRSESNRLPSP